MASQPSSVSRRPGVAARAAAGIQPDTPVMIPIPQGAANSVRHKTPKASAVNVCDRGLQLKIEMADLEAAYNELKPEIEAYCELNGGTYNSPLGSYATRYTPKWQYSNIVELKRIELKQAEERERLDGSATVINTAVSVAATIVKNSRPKKVEEIR
jgi:hypothetical protein